MNQENKPKTFQVGDTVTWTSQAGGKSKTKTGKVIAVVPKGVNVRQWVPDGFNDSRLPQNLSFRFHESYLIQVGRSKRLYWPLVKYLEKVEIETVILPSEDPEEGQTLIISKVNPDSYEMEWQD